MSTHTLARPRESDAASEKRPGRYRKVEVRTWGDERFRLLTPMPPSGQGLWLYLITGPHTGPIPGLFSAGPAAMAEDLGWPLDAFSDAFGEAMQLGMVHADFKARVVWVPNALKHNKPASLNVVTSWGPEFDLIPECDLKRQAFEALKASIHALGEAFGMAFDKAFTKPSPLPSPLPSPKARAIQEQEQEQEQEQKQKAGTAAKPKKDISDADASSSAKTPTVPCPYPKIIALYHSKLPELPRVKLESEARHKAMRKVWGWVLSSRKGDGTRRAETAEQALQWFGDYYERASANEWLMGRGGKHSDAHTGWRADFDFLLTERGMRHVIEKTEPPAEDAATS